MPDFITPQFITSVIVILVVIHIMLGAAAYQIFLERKISSWAQDRIGPNRVGPWGLLQSIADGLKLFLKEDYVPARSDKALFILAPGLAAIPALIGFAVIPWGGILDLSSLPFGLAEAWGVVGETVRIAAAEVNIGIIYLIAVGSLGVYGIVLGGWASNNKYSFIGGLRAAAQMVSYEIPLGLTLLAIILTAGTIMPLELIARQQPGAAGSDGGMWFLLQHPLAAVLFYVCQLAEANRTPFDLAESDAELVGGFHTEYSSMKWALFFLAEYCHLFTGSAFFVILFLGGWSINPFGVGPDLAMQGGLGLILLQIAVMAGKIFLMICLTMMVRWTVPRFRYDQLMRLAWEGMIPASLLIVLVTSFFVYMGWTPHMWAGSLAMIAFIWLVRPLMPRQANPNHKIALIGSRFSPLRDGEPLAATKSD